MKTRAACPLPFVFLAQVAAQTTRIRLGTGIVTLPLELPIRVAEDSAVLDLMCGGRLEVGVGGGGNLSSYAAFGQNSAERTAVLVAHLQVLRDAWRGGRCPAEAIGCIRRTRAWSSASGRPRSRSRAPSRPAPRETVSCSRGPNPVPRTLPTCRWSSSRTR